ncbi:MAG TPA: hypothetical protein VF601_13600 [Beijerinckiaceae bacterium]|jgi:hypothetical protein
MRHLFTAAAAAFLLAAAPAVRAAPAAPDVQIEAQTLADHAVAYAKKGGKGWHGKKVRRGGPPPWAPAWGRRYRR